MCLVCHLLSLQNFGKDKSYISNVQDNDWFFLVIDRQAPVKHKIASSVMRCFYPLFFAPVRKKTALV